MSATLGLKSVLVAVSRLVAAALAIASFYAYLRSLAPIYWDFEFALAVAIGLALWGWPTYVFVRASAGSHRESKSVSGFAQFLCIASGDETTGRDSAKRAPLQSPRDSAGRRPRSGTAAPR
jgi:hypothetical protein